MREFYCVDPKHTIYTLIVKVPLSDRSAASNPTGPSRTAELMAVHRGLESHHPDRLFTDPLAATLVSPPWRLVLAATRLGPVRRMVETLYDHIAGPGPRASAVARTRLIDDLVTDAAHTANQIVILGAGHDTRAHRLPALADHAVFEVDHPATQALKRARLARTGGGRLHPVTFVPVDLQRDDLIDALRAAHYDTATAGVFVLEGVTNYLSASAVDTTFAAIRHLAAAGSYLVFTYVDRKVLTAGGVAAFPEAQRWLEQVTRRGEPWTFGFDPSTITNYLSQRGFTLTADHTTAQAADRYFPLSRRQRGSGLYHVVTATTA